MLMAWRAEEAVDTRQAGGRLVVRRTRARCLDSGATDRTSGDQRAIAHAAPAWRHIMYFPDRKQGVLDKLSNWSVEGF